MEGIEELANLQELMLINNSIREICEFKSADNLHTLNLGANQLGLRQVVENYFDEESQDYKTKPMKSTVFAPLKKMKKLTKLSLF